MNYGKFFRLNKNLSRIEEGYAVYDYIDLPAYFTRSLDNQMSPKYPVSMSILADSVVFKLHYSAFKIEESSEVLPDQTDSKYPKYLYDIKDNTQKNGGCLKSGDTTKIVHMEEAILELPYTDTVGRNLSDTIRDTYSTNFPLISNVTDVSGSNTIKKDSSGGRFLHNLIRKRYLEENVEEEKDIHSHFYLSLRRINDGTPSYSTLWLMGLIMGEKDNVRYVGTDKKGNIVGFLRKLLLDFMFDLKHSDVFQNSASYQKMYSGLMSNFYFSALMHKCEYYYYRKITSQAIDNAGKEDRVRITELYADELIKAEDLWIEDIMDPQAEKHFEHYHSANKWYHEILGNYSFSRWSSWFAEPEEEMRRVCFTMIERGNNVKHICNAETLVECLGLERQSSKNVLAIKMVKSRDESCERISRWFLKRYDFNDVIHFHVAKHLNLVLFVFIICSLLYLFDAYETLSATISILNSPRIRWALIIAFAVSFCVISLFNRLKDYMYRKNEDYIKTIFTSIKRERKRGLVTVIIIIGITLLNYYWENIFSVLNSTWIHFIQLGCWSVMAEIVGVLDARKWCIVISIVLLLILLYYWIRGLRIFKYDKSKLPIARKVVTIKKILGPLLIIIILLFAYHSYSSNGRIVVFSALIIFFVVLYNNRWFGIMPTIHPISCLHLLFPRLVAAITAAWFAMSMGFDIYVSFFDAFPAWYTALAISIVVFGFIMYEINRIMPSSSPIRKIYRSFEFLVISYCISLLVGLVVINFVGEKFLERGGYIGDYYEQHVDNKRVVDTIPYNSNANGEILNDSQWVTYGKAIINRLNDINDPNDIPNIKKVENLQEVTKDGHKIVEKKNILGFNIYFMHDFLIMFSFIAMFWGIFIQMIFTGEKQMTEL